MAVESKKSAAEGIPQARVYQLCMPNVYVASLESKIENDLAEKFQRYGIGYVSVSEGEPKVLIESRVSPFFNRRFYESEVVPRVVMVLGFCDFMTRCLDIKRDDIQSKIDLGVKLDYLWVSDRKSSEGIQWSSIYTRERFRFGLNLESVKAITTAFARKSEKDILDVFNKIRELPRNFYVKFERRCPEGSRFIRGAQHHKFRELGWNEKIAPELEDKDVKFMLKKAKEDNLIEFGIWAEICRKEEITVLKREDLWRKMEYHKKEYLDTLYEILK